MKLISYNEKAREDYDYPVHEPAGNQVLERVLLWQHK